MTTEKDKIFDFLLRSGIFRNGEHREYETAKQYVYDEFGHIEDVEKWIAEWVKI